MQAEKKEADHARDNAAAWLNSILEMVAELEAAEEADDDEKREEAERRIQESALSVRVRDGWRDPYAPIEANPEEYEILLSWGGPSLRITGSLNCGQPGDFPRMEHQNWGTAWTEFEPAREYRAELQRFASAFYFGE